MDFLPEALRPLAAFKQFVVWKAVKVPNEKKAKKYPVNPKTGFYPVSAHDPEMWLTADEAITIAKKLGYGVGFSFTRKDPFWFLDIDNCFKNGQWSDLSKSLCGAFPGCAVELSHSQKGLHIIGTGVAPEHGKRNDNLGLEFYTEARFIALTGASITGSAAVGNDTSIEWLVNSYFPPKEVDDNVNWTDYPCNDWEGPEDDAELIQKIKNSKSAASMFSGRATVQQLWDADADALAATYPDETGNNNFNHSSADAALCSHLAFWTGKDCERMDRLFRLSGLTRDKWVDREDYRRSTIILAVGNCTAVYTGGKQKPPESIEPKKENTTTEVKLKVGLQFLAAPQQVELFKGCTYISDVHRIIAPTGQFLSSEKFRALYGGYTFGFDDTNEATTRNAWECFTESQAVDFPKVNTSCFRPELEPLSILKEDGLLMVNTYVPIITPRTPGDPSMWVNHLAKMVPNDRDREILLSYAAACVQYPGKKFQWAPLVQGIEGNGKSLFFEAIAQAVGYKYTHKPPAKDIDNVFNAWISNKLFIIVEEVYTADRREVIDALKPLITDKRVPITPKGVDQITGDNRANFGLTTNHKDAIRKTRNDRRFAIFFTAQQEPEDLDAAGMRGSYFPDMVTWLEDKGGYAIVNNYLREYQIKDEFNPTGLCNNAPDTSSTLESLALSLGPVEQELIECINSERPGFKGGWISSIAFDKLLDEKRASARIVRNRRAGILESLGYIRHPSLLDGRLTRNTQIDGGKPVLFIKSGHIHCNLQTVDEIERVYSEAQGGSIGPAGKFVVDTQGNKD